MTDVEKMFEPSWYGWFVLIPQRLRSQNSKEDPEFMARFQQMVKVRDDLKKIEQSLTRWSASMNKLYVAAKSLGIAVETDAEVMKEACWNGDILAEDNSALQSIREKINMIDALIAQKSKLKFMRLKGNAAERKLEQLRKKEAAEGFERRSEKYLHIKKESERQREEVMQQILLVVNKYVDQANQYGVSDLVKPQLQAFKLSQFHMFLNCQKLVQGRESDENMQELEQFWNSFTAKIASQIPNSKAGSFDGSAMFLREKLGAAVDDELEKEQNGYGNEYDEEEEDDDEVDDALERARKAEENKLVPSKPPPAAALKNSEYQDSDFDGEDLDDLGDDDDDDDDDDDASDDNE